LDKGFLMFAYNNDSIDYVTMALCNALLIKKNLTINKVALVTNSGTLSYLQQVTDPALIDTAFDYIILNDIIETGVAVRKYRDTRYTDFTDRYYNINRINAYELSPFDQTMMIDTDFLMLDSSMDLVWDCDEDFMCNRKTVTLEHSVNSFGFDNRFNEMSIPLYWATAIYFKKTERSKIIFEMINFIKENYEYYGDLYNFQPCGYFRNDFALSIAMHIVNNGMEYGAIKSLPVDYLLVSLDTDEMHEFTNGQCLVTSEGEPGQFKLHRISTNLHMMNKRAILRYKDQIISYATV
jgi:hypothetical protein